MLEKNKKLHNVFRHNCSQRYEISDIPEEVKNCSGLIPLYNINCQPKRHHLYIKGICQNEGYFEIYQ